MAAQSYLYIMTNPGMPGLVKIGSTNRHPYELAPELPTTGVPTKFAVFSYWTVSAEYVQDIKQRIHAELHQYRYSRNREFFELDATEAKLWISKYIDNYCEWLKRLPENKKRAKFYAEKAERTERTLQKEREVQALKEQKEREVHALKEKRLQDEKQKIINAYNSLPKQDIQAEAESLAEQKTGLSRTETGRKEKSKYKINNPFISLLNFFSFGIARSVLEKPDKNSNTPEKKETRETLRLLITQKRKIISQLVMEHFAKNGLPCAIEDIHYYSGYHHTRYSFNNYYMELRGTAPYLRDVYHSNKYRYREEEIPTHLFLYKKNNQNQGAFENGPTADSGPARPSRLQRC